MWMPVSDVDEKMVAVSEMRVFLRRKKQGSKSLPQTKRKGRREGKEAMWFRLLAHGFGCGAEGAQELWMRHRGPARKSGKVKIVK